MTAEETLNCPLPRDILQGAVIRLRDDLSGSSGAESDLGSKNTGKTSHLNCADRLENFLPPCAPSNAPTDLQIPGSCGHMAFTLRPDSWAPRRAEGWLPQLRPAPV